MFPGNDDKADQLETQVQHILPAGQTLEALGSSLQHSGTGDQKRQLATDASVTFDPQLRNR